MGCVGRLANVTHANDATRPKLQLIQHRDVDRNLHMERTSTPSERAHGHLSYQYPFDSESACARSTCSPTSSTHDKYLAVDQLRGPSLAT